MRPEERHLLKHGSEFRRPWDQNVCERWGQNQRIQANVTHREQRSYFAPPDSTHLRIARIIDAEIKPENHSRRLENTQHLACHLSFQIRIKNGREHNEL